MTNGRVRSIPVLVLLSIVTCGLYPLVWYYEVSGELQDATGRIDTSPGLEVLLMILTCGLYTIYWWYKYGRLAAEAEALRGLPVRDNAVVLCVISALAPYILWNDIIGMCILQSDLNAMWEARPF
ncbi:MAG TPA: DUF4234 domain-containing protein [Armatimonadota bacterium]